MSPIAARRPGLWHGGDYNPEQWQEHPEVLERDLELMKRAGCTVMSVGIFAWAALEPEEGRFEFGWLDRVFDAFERNGLSIDLATPSGARPRWLAERHPEVLRVDADRRRRLFGTRHNHCPTAPAYRERVAAVNTALAQRYGGRPALVLWHVSNEYNGDCHCDLCQEAFRAFLRARYGSLEALNRAWWTPFWSRTYTRWEQVESSSPIGEGGLNGLYIDWKRFVTAQTIDFLRAEIAPLRRHAPGIPVTTNLMGYHPIELDLHALCRELDIASWDAYPAWHAPEGDPATAQNLAMLHDLTRSFRRGRPFLLMESSPGSSNWQCVARRKRPGMQRLAGLMAVASGADGVMYFQWRKGRGGCEKHLGAVVGHDGRDDTATFREVAALGRTLSGLAEVAGSQVPAEVAIIGDWQNWWALHDCNHLRRDKRDHWDFVRAHHRGFYRQGIATDIIDAEADLAPYRLVVAPLLYMVRPGVAERLAAFVERGGTLVLTFWSGQVDESDLCFLDSAPGPLRRLAGLRVEELDVLYPGEKASLSMAPGNALGLEGTWAVDAYREVVHAEGCTVLATHDGPDLGGQPALTVNSCGKGRTYYLAANPEAAFLDAFHQRLADGLALPRALDGLPPDGVCARRRRAGDREYLFLLNFAEAERRMPLPAGWTVLDGPDAVAGVCVLPSLGGAVLRRAAPEKAP